MKHFSPGMLQVLCITTLMLFGTQIQTASGQTPTPAAAPTPQLLSITVVSVKPEMAGEFRNFMKNTTNPALKKGGATMREVWQTTAAGGDVFEYVIVAPVSKFAEFDGPSALEKALGAEGMSAWQAKAGTLVNSVRRIIIRTRPSLSYSTMQNTLPKLAVVHWVHVAAGRNADYENYLTNHFVPVMKQAKVPYLVSQTLFGGDANEYVTLTLRDTFADLDKGPVVTQALGEEGAEKLFKNLPAGTVVHVERSIARFVPELSIIPSPQ